MKTTHKKVDVKLIIEKIATSASPQQINEIGPVMVAFIRGSVSESTLSFNLNEDINVQFNFISTFILRNAKDRQYKEKELQFFIRTIAKKKDILKTSVNLAEYFTQSETNHTLNFSYKGIGMQLIFSVYFGGKTTHIVTQNIQQPKRQLAMNAEHTRTTSCQSVNPSSYTRQTTASSQLSGFSGRGKSQRGDVSQPNTLSKGSGSIQEQNCRVHKKTLSKSGAFPLNERGDVEMLRNKLPLELQKFIEDLKRASALMEFDSISESEKIDMKTNTLMSELIYKVLIEKNAFEGSEDLLEETNNCLLEVCKNDLSRRKETIYMYSTITRVIMLLKKESNKTPNQHIDNFIKVLFESTIILYNKLFKLLQNELKQQMENIFKKKLMECNDLIKYIEGLRIDFETTRILPIFISSFVDDLIRNINILFIEEVINPHANNCTVEIGMNSFMIISFLEDYFRGKHSFHMEKRDQFIVIAETSRVLLLNDKKILVDEEARTNICPHLSLTKISVLLENLNVTNNEDELTIKRTISDITKQEFENAKYDYQIPTLSETQMISLIQSNTLWDFIPFDISSIPTFAKRMYFQN